MSGRNWARDKARRQGRATYSEQLAADAHMRTFGRPAPRQLSKAELRAQLAAAMARSNKKAAGV